MLADGTPTLTEIADGILEVVGADRVSIAEIDEADDAFEIIEARGEALLGPGTRFPLGTSTHHRAAAEDTLFVSSDFDRRRGFSRPLDRIVRAHGFRSGASLPLRHVDGRPGALNLHFDVPGACGVTGVRARRAVAGGAVARARAAGRDRSDERARLP